MPGEVGWAGERDADTACFDPVQACRGIELACWMPSKSVLRLSDGFVWMVDNATQG